MRAFQFMVLAWMVGNRSCSLVADGEPDAGPSALCDAGAHDAGPATDAGSETPPPPGGFSDIELLPPSATLPTVHTCAVRVHASAWEPRPQNEDENYNTADLVVPAIDGVDDDAQAFYLTRIAAVNQADIVGTTDELIQFFSCYWGVDDESMRARALIESSWDQEAARLPSLNVA
jgi:hypothetical protein